MQTWKTAMDLSGPITERRHELMRLAGKQHGYFTAAQAMKIGYVADHHLYHIKKGNWLHVSRGIFRLPGHNDTPESDFTKWYLWSRNQNDQPQGVISHASALAVHGLREYDPREIHLTVPQSFRKKAPDEIKIHKATLSLSAIEHRSGFMVTRLWQTLADLRPEWEGSQAWEALLSQVVAQNLLSREELSGLGAEPASDAAVWLDNSGVSHSSPRLAKNSAGEPVLDPLVEGVWKMIFNRSETGRRRAQAGFTLVELLVVTAIISVLAGLLLPSLEKALASARAVYCTNNLKQLYLSIVSYADDSNGFMPPHLTNAPQYHPRFIEALDAIIPRQLYLCPAMPAVDLNAIATNWYYQAQYGCNAYFAWPSDYAAPKLAQINQPSGKFLEMDAYRNNADGSSNLAQGYWRVCRSLSTDPYSGRPAGRHQKFCNILWCDGHVGSVRILDIHDPYLQEPFTMADFLCHYVWNK